jgi:hypothetical protein
MMSVWRPPSRHRTGQADDEDVVETTTSQRVGE